MTLDILIEAREALKLSLSAVRDTGSTNDYLRVMRAEIRLGFQIDKLTSCMAVEVAT